MRGSHLLRPDRLVLALTLAVSAVPAAAGEAVAPEAAKVAPAAAEAPSKPAAAMVWSSDLEASLRAAKAAKKPVIIDFFADWCGACKELDRFTYSDPRVIEAAGRFVLVKVDGTEEDDRIEALYERFQIQGLPTVVFLDSRGETLADPRILGFVDAGEFLAAMKKVR